VTRFSRRIGPRRLIPTFAAPIAAIALLSGCGASGPEMASVSGKVTYNGKPVSRGLISFQTTAPDGRNATGMIQPDGSYELQTENPRDGALLGNYRVSISAREEEEILMYIPKKPVKPKRLIPEKYENPATSNLTATVASGSNTHNFELTD